MAMRRAMAIKERQQTCEYFRGDGRTMHAQQIRKTAQPTPTFTTMSIPQRAALQELRMRCIQDYERILRTLFRTDGTHGSMPTASSTL
jgi:hypothetical protein